MSPSGKKRARPAEEKSQQSNTQDQNEFEKLLAEFDYAFKRGDVIKGTVISADSSGALIDIGAKTAAYVPRKEAGPHNVPITDSLNPGTEYEFYILREENEEGQFTLSRRRVYVAQTWQRLEEIMNKDEVIEGTVTAVVKGGLLIDVMGLRGFVPSSHLRVKESFDSLVGKQIPLKIINLEQATSNIILSHRKVVAEHLAEQRKELFDKIQEGAIVEGEVVRLTDFGAFIDLGGVDGLLPLSQMSWRWVEHPSDILSIGDKVKVEVIGVDLEKQRVSLSIKSQFEDPWNEVVKELGLHDQVEGTVTRIKHFGAFVEVYPGVEALLPSKDIMDHEHAGGPKLESGQKIKTYIVKFNPEERRISLSFNPSGPGGGGYDAHRQETAANAD